MSAVPPPIDRIDLDRHLVAKGGLAKFFRLAWQIVEPSAPYVHGWHIDEIAEHLEAVHRKEITNLVISVPPGMSKSLLVSVVWPVWCWIDAPELRFMAASFDQSLSTRDAMRSKELINSRWFQDRWGKRADTDGLKRLGLKPIEVVTEGKQDTSQVYWNSLGGMRFSTSVGGKATGWHAHRQIADDPNNPKEVELGGAKAIEALARTDAWWSNRMASRKADPKNFARVIIMQRLHAADLAGKCIDAGYEALVLPMEHDTRRHCVTRWGGDRRTEPGELLCPERFPADVVAQTKKDMGSRVANAQLQQDPAPESGTVFKRAWFERRWHRRPTKVTRRLFSWDCTFKGSSDSDYVVGTFWEASDADFYLVDLIRARMDFPDTIEAILEMRRRYPECKEVVIEDKANGPAIEQTLRQRVPGIVMFDPHASKVARANAVAPFCEAGNVILPKDAPWLGDYLEALCGFPHAAYDDEVDSTTQALLRLTGTDSPARRLLRAMQNVR